MADIQISLKSVVSVVMSSSLSALLGFAAWSIISLREDVIRLHERAGTNAAAISELRADVNGILARRL